MKSKIVILMVFCLIFVGGCKKTVYTENTKTSDAKGSVFTTLDGTGRVKEDTELYTSSEFDSGLILLVGETVTLLGESEEHYICFYQDVKGYIDKKAIELVEGEESKQTNNANGNGQRQEVIIREHVKEEIFEERPSNTVATVETLKPPTIYTTKHDDVAEISDLLGKSINKARASRGLTALTMNAALSKQAAYYSDKFATGKSIFQVEGFGVQVSGKMADSNKLAELGEPIVEKILGFDGKNLRKFGIAVVKSGDGTFYYCVLAQ